MKWQVRNMTKELHEKLYHIRYHCLSSKGKQYLDEIEELLENCLTPVAVIDCKIDEKELQKIIKNTVVTISNDEPPTVQSIPLDVALDIVHKTIYTFFDVVDDDSEEPISAKDELLLKVNKSISEQLKGYVNEC